MFNKENIGREIERKTYKIQEHDQRGEGCEVEVEIIVTANRVRIIGGQYILDLKPGIRNHSMSIEASEITVNRINLDGTPKKRHQME